MAFSPEHPNGIEIIEKTVDLKDVEAFEVETRQYGEPVFFVARVPAQHGQ